MALLISARIAAVILAWPGRFRKNSFNPAQYRVR
jgi:hypothetical protein